MKKRLISIAAIFGVVLSVLLGFQNCGQVEFTQSAAQKAGDSDGSATGNEESGDSTLPPTPPGGGPNDPGTQPPTGGVPPTSEPPVIDPPFVDPPVVDVPVIPPPMPECPAGEVYVDGECRAEETTFTDCQSFVELNTNVIPNLETNGICYYKKLISSLSAAPSGSRGEVKAEDVLSRRHGGATGNVAPNVLGDSDAALGGRLSLTFLAKRKISFTSDKVGSVAEIANKSLRIDNYILVELFHNGLFQHAMARGTADALLTPGNGPIQLNGEPVHDFISYAPGGTANVGVISYSEQVAPDLLPVLTPVQFRVRMLDCGGSAQSSDMYVIIH